MIDKNTLTQELEAWASLYGCQLIDYQSIIESHTLRKLSEYVPINIIYGLDTSTQKNNFDLPQHTVEIEEDGETRVYTYGPKTLTKVYTPVSEYENDPSIVQIADYAGSLLYCNLDKDFMYKFTHNSKLMFVPDVPDDVDEVYVEFQYDWVDILQLPDAFWTSIVTASKWALFEVLYNRSMLSDIVTNKYEGRENVRDLIEAFESQLKRTKDEFIQEADKLDQTFNQFQGAY